MLLVRPKVEVNFTVEEVEKPANPP